MNFRKIILSSLFYIGLMLWCSAQELAVVYISGNIQVFNTKESPKTAKNLIYGPLLWEQSLILRPGSSIKILRQNGEICELSIAGQYDVSKLKFTPKSESSLLTKFSSYFLSFFGSQNTSENKDSHYNSIFAVSRGDEDIPQLIFPFQDKLSLDDKVIEFHWAHACDSCNFILQIYEFKTKSLVFQSYIKSKSYQLINPIKVLKPGQKYFWNIQLDKSIQKSVSNSFTISDVGQFNQAIKGIHGKLTQNKLNSNSLAGQIITTAHLLEAGQTNFAFQYARKIKIQNPKNKLLAQKLDELCKKEVLKKLTE